MSRANEVKGRGKIWAVFFVSLVTIASVLFWSYAQFQTLTQSLEELSRPGETGEVISGIFQDIVEAENDIHVYILTGDTRSRTKYRNTLLRVRDSIVSLRTMLEDDSTQVMRVDKLKEIFDLKINYLERYLRVKKLNQSSLFTSEALERIAAEMNDTAFVDTQLLKRQILKSEVIPVETEEIIITPDEFKGVSGFLRKLLGRDRTRIDTMTRVYNELAYSYDVEVDTSVVRDYFRDSTLIAVKDILARVMRKEAYLQQRLSETELNLMRQNEIFIASIREVIGQLQAREEALAALRQRESKSLAHEATLTLAAIGFAGVVMSGIFIFLILKDVTRAHHYRRRLEEEIRKVGKLARVKEDFVASMSHEIRTPLHNILGFTSLLEKTAMDEQQKTYMRAIRDSNKYLSELVNNMLDQAKIDAGKLELASEPFDLAAVVGELKSAFSYNALTKNIELRAEVSSKLNGLYLVGDAFRVKQILTNLLGNAVKFTDSGSVTVSVDGTQRDDMFDLTIAVSDTGPGIAPDKLEAIFEPFVQGQPGIERTFGGSGLGLSITRSLVERMNGSIHAKNNPGGGVTFTVSMTLPWVTAHVPAEDAAHDGVVTYPHATVVVVDDDQWNAVLLREMLVPRVGAVHVFHEAIEALAFLENGGTAVNIVFTDISMPGMSGEALMQKVKVVAPGLPVIAVTAHMDPERFERLRSNGFDDVCRKPFSIVDIENLLQKYAGIPVVKAELISPNGMNDADESGMLDLSLIRGFAGDSEERFASLVATLAENNERQVQTFRECLTARDSEGLAAISHQMKTTYDNLRITNVSESLASIEVMEMMGKTGRMFEVAQEVSPELDAVLDALRKIRRQYHTV